MGRCLTASVIYLEIQKTYTQNRQFCKATGTAAHTVAYSSTLFAHFACTGITHVFFNFDKCQYNVISAF